MLGLPPNRPGLRVGLYGGSFDPAHAGHFLVAETAYRRLGLDRVWWMVTPGNPLKDRSGLKPMAERMEAAEALAAHPAMVVTGFEAGFKTRYTVDTIRVLVRRCPGVKFVWIMGADSLASFARWHGWQEMAALVPMAVVDRPDWTLRAIRSRAAQALASYRIPQASAPVLADLRAPAWTFLTGPRSELSSTELRARAASVR